MSWQYIVITGASRGFGRSVAISYAKTNVASHFVLTGRSLNDLKTTKEGILSARKDASTGTIIDLVECDLSSCDLEAISGSLFEKPFQSNPGNVYDKVVFINNAGSLGPLQSIGSGESFALVSNTLDLNVKACLYLSAQIIEKYSSKRMPTSVTKLEIVNVSSLAAVMSFESWGYYCAGKAARDMFHKTIALEHVNDGVVVINYAPGPLDTDMQKEIREGAHVKEETRKYYASMKEENKLVDPQISADKLLKILATGVFSSGSHVDFYDEVEGVDKVVKAQSCCGSGGCCGKSCCGPTCNCGADCSCGPSSNVKSACGSDSCGCGADCQCGTTCTYGKPSVAVISTSVCGKGCCGSNCNCGTNCCCGTSTISAKSACGCDTCGCGEECRCGSDCSCGKSSKETTFIPSCRAASVCTCGPTCDCKEMKRPGCGACADFVASLDK